MRIVKDDVVRLEVFEQQKLEERSWRKKERKRERRNPKRRTTYIPQASSFCVASKKCF